MKAVQFVERCSILYFAPPPKALYIRICKSYNLEVMQVCQDFGSCNFCMSFCVTLREAKVVDGLVDQVSSGYWVGGLCEPPKRKGGFLWLLGWSTLWVAFNKGVLGENLSRTQDNRSLHNWASFGIISENKIFILEKETSENMFGCIHLSVPKQKIFGNIITNISKTNGKWETTFYRF